jgi:hypothetical protein
MYLLQGVKDLFKDDTTNSKKRTCPAAAFLRVLSTGCSKDVIYDNLLTPEF